MSEEPRISGLPLRTVTPGSAPLMRALPGWMLVVLLIAAFLMGGGARDDIVSLVILRPLSFVLLGVGLATLRIEHVRANRTAFAVAAGMVALVALHLVPLSPELWHGLPVRELLVQADRLSGAGQVARPLTMNPVAGWNAAYALAAPLAALVLAVQLESDGRKRVRYLLLGVAAISALLGLLQAIGPAKGPLYLYRITNPTSPVGLFANRNHQAVFLASMLPLLALMATSGRVPARGRPDRRPLWLAVALAAGVLLVSTIVASGSRAGLGAAVVAVAFLPFVLGVSYAEGWRWLIHRRAGKTPASRAPWRALAALVLAAALVALFSTAGRETALDRLASEDSRGPAWRVIIGLIRDHFPWGSGLGSFVEAFQVAEPDSQLRLTYLNHAHNDLLEVAMTLGLPGLALVAVMLFGLAAAALRLFATRRDAARSEERAALVALFLLAAGSLVDYPLRTPALACLFAALVPWLGQRSELDGPSETARRLGR